MSEDNQIEAVTRPSDDSVLHPTRRGIALFAENPFMIGTHVRAKRTLSKRGEMMLVDSNNGDIHSSVAGFWESQEVDSTQFVKLFIGGVKAMTGLNKAAGRVFEVVYAQVQSATGKDKIYLNYLLVDTTKGKMSLPTYNRGIADLVLRGFIAPSLMAGWYWINPTYIWNGDKLAFVKQYHKKSKPNVAQHHFAALERAGQQRLEVDTPQERIDEDGVITRV